MSNNSATQNVQQDEFRDLKDILRKHVNQIAVGLCIALAVTVSVVLYRSRARAKVQQASHMLSSAHTIQDLEAITMQYPSSAVAPLAMMQLAKVYYNAGKYDMALDKYIEFGLKFPDHQMAAAAELGRIHCLEARGRLGEAYEGFTAFLADHPDDFLTFQAVFGRARCLEQLGRYTEAKELYEGFIEAHPESSWTSRAEELLGSVNRKLEETSSGTKDGNH